MNPMDENKGVRKSDRSNKGVQPQRFGFENYGVFSNDVIQTQSENGATGDANSSFTDTLVRADNIINQKPKFTKSVTSKATTKGSKQSSIRNIEFLKKKMEREAEIHKIEMKKLEMEKAFIKRAQQIEEEMKIQEIELSNELNDEVEISEMDPNQRKITNEWVNKIPRADHQSAQHLQFESTHLNGSAVQSDVLLAAFRALQTKEIKDLPIFNGDSVLEWPNFISEFRRSTEEYDIKPNKNLRRLNKALDGDARSSVQTLLTSPDNIEEIISHLEMCFGRKEWILQHLVFELRSLPIMDEDEDIHEFKIFYNKLFGAITTIKNMKAENYMDNPELLACLEEKLPPTTKNYWIHHKADLQRKNTKVNIADFGEWFKFELDAQYAGLSAKDVIKKYHKPMSDNHYDSSYTADGKKFP